MEALIYTVGRWLVVVKSYPNSAECEFVVSTERGLAQGRYFGSHKPRKWYNWFHGIFGPSFNLWRTVDQAAAVASAHADRLAARDDTVAPITAEMEVRIQMIARELKYREQAIRELQEQNF